MEFIKIEDLSFTYPQRSKKALCNINLTINKGDFILLCGKSGSSKTTLLRLLKPSLSPFGNIEGNIYFKGKNLNEYSKEEHASLIGYVLQNPDSQIVTDKVWHELSFGLENLGVGQNEINMRISEMASFFGIGSWFYKNTDELSGGQKQILNLASVMVTRPEVLILDEPTSSLDPISAGDFIKTLEKINKELGTTIILSEHFLDEVFPLCSKVVVIDEGEIVLSDENVNIGKKLKELNHDMYNSLPTYVKIHTEIKNDYPCPLNIKDAKAWICKYLENHTLNPEKVPKDNYVNNEDTIVQIKDAYFKYKKDDDFVLKGVNLKVKRGEIFSILGENASGKTTMLSLISGLNKPYMGEVFINGKKISRVEGLYNGILGVLPQNVQSLFLKKTVYLDLMETLSTKKISKEEKENKIRKFSSLCKIDNLFSFHPFDLSGGEMQRVALCKILLNEPKILLLDEPTKGMDAFFKEEFGEILLNLKNDGVTIILVSHDIEFCARFSDKCSLFFDGKFAGADTTRKFFSDKNFYTTSANRIIRDLIPDAILYEDIILALNGEVKKDNKKTSSKDITPPKTDTKPYVPTPLNNQKKHTKLSLILSLFMLILIPLTIYLGNTFLYGRKYYFISMLIILETLIPFCMMFEKRRVKASELVIISALCAIATIGRTAFFMIPEFKPTLAIIIITGVCFGYEAGFLVGALTGFISNFFFGQGPWTPYQMFSLGIIGMMAGMVFKLQILKKYRLIISLFGFLSAFLVYGFIMNSASIVMVQSKITWEMVITSCLMGMPFDLIHAISTFVFLFVISLPFIEKLERIKIKYGLIKK